MAVTTDVAAAAERYLALTVEASAGPAPIVELVLGDPPPVEEPRPYMPRRMMRAMRAQVNLPPRPVLSAAKPRIL